MDRIRRQRLVSAAGSAARSDTGSAVIEFVASMLTAPPVGAAGERTCVRRGRFRRFPGTNRPHSSRRDCPVLVSQTSLGIQVPRHTFTATPSWRLARISSSWINDSGLLGQRPPRGPPQLVKPVLTTSVCDRFWSGRCGGIFPARSHSFQDIARPSLPAGPSRTAARRVDGPLSTAGWSGHRCGSRYRSSAEKAKKMRVS